MIKNIFKIIAKTFGPALSNIRLLSTIVIITFCICALMIFSVCAIKIYYMLNADSIIIILLSFLTSTLTIVITGKVQQKKTELGSSLVKEPDADPPDVKNI